MCRARLQWEIIFLLDYFMKQSLMYILVLGKLYPRKIAPSPNSNANPKPSPDPDWGGRMGGVHFRTPYISLHLIWLHEIHIKYVKRKPRGTKIGKKWIQKRATCLLVIEHIFSKKTTKQKMKQKWSAWVKPWLKKCMYTSPFNNIFAELI